MDGFGTAKGVIEVLPRTGVLTIHGRAAHSEPPHNPTQPAASKRQRATQVDLEAAIVADHEEYLEAATLAFRKRTKASVERANQRSIKRAARLTQDDEERILSVMTVGFWQTDGRPPRETTREGAPVMDDFSAAVPASVRCLPPASQLAAEASEVAAARKCLVEESEARSVEE